MLDKNACILVVDDMKMVRKSIIQLLKSMGYSTFLEAENGSEAISKYKSNEVGLAFMDLVMPMKDGYIALKEIRGYDESANVAILSSVADTHAVTKCLGQGAIGYVHKPITRDNGVEKLKKILEKLD